jgi:hypothetical protein
LEVLREGLDARSLALSKYALDALPFGIVGVGENGAVALANAAAGRLLGEEGAGNLLGRAFAALVARSGVAVQEGRAVDAPGWRGSVHILEGRP